MIGFYYVGKFSAKAVLRFKEEKFVKSMLGEETFNKLAVHLNVKIKIKNLLIFNWSF